MKKKFVIISASIAALAVLALVSVLGVFAYAGANLDFDTDELLFERAKQGTTVEYYAYGNGGELIEIYEGSFGGRKVWSELGEISDYLKTGFVSTEDRDFYSHSGVNIKRTLGAGLNYFFHFTSDFGGSTINQQVIKNISGDNEYSVRRKLNEIIRAYHLDTTYGKDEILELYMNIVPMTGNIYGVGAASEVYFGKAADELTLAEAATIVGITNSPSKYNPYLHPEECLKRRNTVLYAMHEDGAISDEEYGRAKIQPLEVVPAAGTDYSSWFIETVNNDIIADAVGKYKISESAARLMLCGAKVYTTVDIEIQEILESFFENYDNLPDGARSGIEIAMSVVDNKSGNLVGVIGGVGEKKGDKLLNNALTPIIPASAIKPLSLYAPMLDRKEINWATVLDDVPVSFVSEGDNLRGYPRNSPDVYDGLTTVADGIRLSKNTLAARLYGMSSVGEIRNTLINDYSLKLSDEDMSLAALALGQFSVGTSLRSLTDAYTVFPNDGVTGQSRSYYGVITQSGEVILENTVSTKQVLSPETARIMCKMLERVTDSGTAKRVTLKSLIDVGGKTGTSSGNLDKTFIGFTPYYTAGIWMGRPDRTDGVSGVSPGHIEIWDRVMTEIHKAKVFNNKAESIENFKDEGLLYLPYCKDSGHIFTDTCELDPRGNRMEYGFFTADNKPTDECKTHVLCGYDVSTMSVAHAGCPEENVIQIALLNIKRSFPAEITVTDAEFVYRDIGNAEISDRYDVPYFINTLEEGEFVGRSKGKKQFNSGCSHHK